MSWSGKRASGRWLLHFWRDALSWHGTVTPFVMPQVLLFGLYGLLVGIVHELYDWTGLESGPVQFTAAFLALLLVLRTNSGYERWWEARKLWGGIVNQSRNLAIAGLSYGPRDTEWRERFVRWTIAFSHVSRRSLRGERELPELISLLRDGGAAERIARAQHMPSFVAQAIAGLLREAMDRGGMERVALLAIDQERARLIDHVGGCERILKTPLPRVHTVKLRRFILLYLLALPIAVVGPPWWVPGLVTALVAYPLLAIDQIAVELENPFSPRNLSHLPLHSICETIEGNLLALLDEEESLPMPPPRGRAPRVPLPQPLDG
ncbi:bestrophin family protein [Archangium lipolyticum]|uniref:bestrophin family protein n=1 Tax=Archangium lipolyticum TaxID=2970465 RepID=UPI00214A3485|nr:bestrophin family ion channel [Archangium lipolyticum]